jgi:hypothetical protein
MTPCSPLSVNRRLGGTYRLHLQGRRNKFSKKKIASKQVIFFITTAVKTSNPTNRNPFKSPVDETCGGRDNISCTSSKARTMNGSTSCLQTTGTEPQSILLQRIVDTLCPHVDLYSERHIQQSVRRHLTVTLAAEN